MVLRIIFLWVRVLGAKSEPSRGTQQGQAHKLAAPVKTPLPSGMEETEAWPQKHRPKNSSEIVGNQSVVSGSLPTWYICLVFVCGLNWLYYVIVSRWNSCRIGSSSGLRWTCKGSSRKAKSELLIAAVMQRKLYCLVDLLELEKLPQRDWYVNYLGLNHLRSVTTQLLGMYILCVKYFVECSDVFNTFCIYNCSF